MRRIVKMCGVLLPVLLSFRASAQLGKIPEGFTPLFDGKTTAGWHWSRTNHHGTTAIAEVENGVLILKPHPFEQGGLFLTDKSYKDFEFYVECLPDPSNSGIFLRSSEGGAAYQVELQIPGGTGGWLGEMIKLTPPQYIGPRVNINTLWKEGEWNSIRVRMVGEAPHVTLWINGKQMWELQEPRNDQLGGQYGGEIGLQLHWGATFTEAGGGLHGNTMSGTPWWVQRFRNIGIKEIK